LVVLNDPGPYAGAMPATQFSVNQSVSLSS
jgi:hypothetical protein